MYVALFMLDHDGGQIKWKLINANASGGMPNDKHPRKVAKQSNPLRTSEYICTFAYVFRAFLKKKPTPIRGGF